MFLGINQDGATHILRSLLLLKLRAKFMVQEFDRKASNNVQHQPGIESVSLGGHTLISPFVTEEQMRAKLQEVGLAQNALVTTALDQAIKSHKDQVREGGAPYLEEHIFPVTISVINHVLEAGRALTPELVAAALTHDVSEDDPEMPIVKLRELFEPLVQYSSDGKTNPTDIVAPLTKPSIDQFPGETKAEKKAARDKAYMDGLHTGRDEVAIIKTADRENNMECSHKLDDPREIHEYCDETIESIIPLAQKVLPGIADSILKRIELLRDVADFRIAIENQEKLEHFRDLAQVATVKIDSDAVVAGTLETAHASLRSGVHPEVAALYKAQGFEDRPTTKEEAERAEVKGWNGLGISLNIGIDGIVSAMLARQQEAELYKNDALEKFKKKEIDEVGLIQRSPNIGGAHIALIVTIDGEEYLFGGRKPELFIGEKQWHPSAAPMNFDQASYDAAGPSLKAMCLETVERASSRGTNDFITALLANTGQTFEMLLNEEAHYFSDAITGTAAIVLPIRVEEDTVEKALASSQYAMASTPLCGVKIADLKNLAIKIGEKGEDIFCLPHGTTVKELTPEGFKDIIAAEFIVRPGAIPYEKMFSA